MITSSAETETMDTLTESTFNTGNENMLQEHQYSIMWNPHWEQEVRIDKKIAPLVWTIWHKLGLHTYNSCEDNFGSVWIEFSHLHELETFLTILARYRDDYPELYAEMMEEWEFRILPQDLAEVLDEEADEVYLDGDSDIIFSPSVRFPKEDLSRVMDCFAQYFSS